MKLERTFDIIEFQLKWHPTTKALNYKIDENWVSFSSEEIKIHVYQIAQGLVETGLNKGDRILVVPRSASPGMIFLDLAAQMIGLLPVIIHATFTKEQLHYVIKEVDPRAIFYTNEEGQGNFRGADEMLPFYTVSIDHNSVFYDRFVVSVIEKERIGERSDEILPSDLALIIYTSGSTGIPKGVMLTHQNIMSNLGSYMPLLPIKPGSVVLTYLPFSHILERAAVYQYLVLGMQIHVVHDMSLLAESLLEIRPHFMTAVPRIIERIFEKMEQYKSRRTGLERRLLEWAIGVGLKYEPYRKFKLKHSIYLFLARHLVLRKLNRAMGGRLLGLVVGGAHLRPALAQLLEVAGIKVREGYGMTETSPIITVNRFEPGMHRLGTVGLPLSNLQIKIDDPKDGEGEILVKGPNVTTGYYQRPDLTALLFDEAGWLKTGDLGSIDREGFLTITGRRKDIFKTSSGKYISPAVLENHFRSSPFISEVLITGFGRPFVTALLVPEFNFLKEWCELHQVHWSSPKYMVHNIKVKAVLQEEIDYLNTDLHKFKRVRKFYLIDTPWTTDNGMLSASLKPMRDLIEQRFKKEIETMYV